eukprot:m.196718 g.196718  ORF g.196718 m.196718 type:complete len:134 (-) comp53751_c0_seq8:80-481(-)
MVVSSALASGSQEHLYPACSTFESSVGSSLQGSCRLLSLQTCCCFSYSVGMQGKLPIGTASSVKERAYPFVRPPLSQNPPQEIIVFYVGGTTFEEAKIVEKFNHDNPNCRVLLGGTTVHNFQSFMRELRGLDG